MKETKPRTHSNNRKKLRINLNKLTLKRLKTSSKMQEKKSIQTCMNQTIMPMRNNWNTQ
jgi:hypothetical protein